jgi:tRNA-dihydrouridine synthase B
MSGLKIGNLNLSSRFILAPLAGVSDLPFRMLNRKFGCELAFAELISARALVQGNRRTKAMLSTSSGDRPLGIQLLGSDARTIAAAIKILQSGRTFDLLDINAACPTKKVTARGDGASLLREPRKLCEIVKSAVDIAAVPVTMKIRTGWDDDSLNARDLALYARDAGINALFIHGRTKVQGYSGSPDYRTIRIVKEALNIPVIASGDILSPQLIQKMFSETGCDGIAIARGAMGNPWIFPQAEASLAGGKLPPRPDPHEIAEVMRDHLRMCCAHYGELIGVSMFRKYFAWYTRERSGVKPLRARAFGACSLDQMLGIIEETRGL